MSTYFVGKGIVYMSTRDGSGNPIKFIDIGNCGSFVLSSGDRAIRNVTNPTVLSKMIPSGNIGTVTLVIDEINKSNLAKAFYGDELSVNSEVGIITAVTVKKGGYIPVAHINISNVSISSGAIEGIDYTYDGPSGMIYFLPDAPNVNESESVNVTYNHSAYNITAAFAKAPEVQWIRFNGINVADNNNPVIVDVYKVRLAPANGLELIGDKFEDFTLTGKILHDSNRVANTYWGNYFRIRSL